MAKAKRPSRVKLMMGAIFASEGILIKAKSRLEQKFGPLDFSSAIIPFNYTKYYEHQMGPNLKRQFFSFKRLIDPHRLVAIKLYTNGLEIRLSRQQTKPPRIMVRLVHRSSSFDRLRTNLREIEGPNHSERSRRINLDPGYISASKLVLATCKNYSHRIYLDHGIYAEVTLHFQDGSFRPFPWTYPDYQTKDYLQNFNTMRKIYLEQLPR